MNATHSFEVTAMTAHEIYMEARKMAFEAQQAYNHAHQNVRSCPTIKAELLRIANACHETSRRLGC